MFGESKFGVGVFKTASEGAKQGNRYGEITKITVPSVAKMYDDGSDGMSGPAVAGLASGGGILCDIFDWDLGRDLREGQ